MPFPLDLDADYRITVHAAAEGQTDQNHFDYRCVLLPNPAHGSLEVLTAFRAMYRANILPLLAATYAIHAYVMQRVGGVNAIGNANASLRMDRDDQMLGDALLDIGLHVGPPNTTFTAVSITKRTEELEMGWAFLPQTLAANAVFRISGGNRFGPVPEDPTVAPTGNRFSDPYWALITDAALAIGDPLVTAAAGATLDPQVLSLRLNNADRTGNPNVGKVYARGAVVTVSAKRKVSSQVSRKDISQF